MLASSEIPREFDYKPHSMNDGWNVQKIEVFLISLTLLFLALVGARAHAESRSGVIENLQTWKQETFQRRDLEAREKDLRLDFIDRLIFQTERKYQEGPLKEFFQNTLEEMADTDEMASNQSFGSMSEFLDNLKESLQTLPEQKENPLQFIQSFTQFSSISKPRTADDFAETRSYFDGRTLTSAKPLDVDQAADFLEKKEFEEQAAKTATEKALFQQDLMDDYQLYPVQAL